MGAGETGQWVPTTSQGRIRITTTRALRGADEMENLLDELEREMQELKARSLTDFALLRCLVGVLPTGELAALKLTFAKLAEDLTVKFMYGSWDEATNQAVQARGELWMGVMSQELQARDVRQPTL